VDEHLAREDIERRKVFAQDRGAEPGLEVGEVKAEPPSDLEVLVQPASSLGEREPRGQRR